MSFADAYLSKQQGIAAHIPEPPSRTLRYAIIIPAFQEENIVAVLDSLWRCARPEGSVEVIIVVNAPDNADRSTRETHAATLQAVKNYSHTYDEDGFRLYALNAASLPQRHAGVGLARKIGMDEAVWRFNSISRPEGLIISLDADCHCDANYFIEIEKNYKSHPRANGFNLYFEHQVSGHEFPDRIYKGIIQYELHLRYYIQALRYAGFPYAFHTVGSCYAVKASAYVKQGGMNRRKSGEDFYFLHKIIPLGYFFEINTTRVIPSSRPSLRVPFGTGPTLQKYLLNESQVQHTYHPELFEMLRDLFSIALQLYKQGSGRTEILFRSLHPLLIRFLDALDSQKAIAEINANCSSPATHTKRFYAWFDGFTTLKFLNYASAGDFSRINVREAALRLLQKKNLAASNSDDDLQILMLYREMEKKETWISPLQR
jgi:hypothetical protein